MHPNIIYIFSDQHRFCDVGYAGNSEVETPNLDNLARTGAWFTSSYSNCPLCVPARGTLLTGLHALKHGAAANDLPVLTSKPSIANILNDAGYNTGYIGKWHLGGVPRNQFIQEDTRLGFTYWNGCNCNHAYMDAYYDDNENVRHKIEGYEPFTQTDLAIQYMNEHKGGGQPWALWLAMGTPHDPYDALPADELARWRSKHLSLRKNVDMENVEHLFGPKPDIENDYAGYYAHIYLLDQQIGRIVDWLRANDELENTIIVYSSDHGDMLGSHGYLNKQMYFEESAKVPLVVNWHGHIPAGQRKQPISLVDHAPTLLGLIGLDGLPDMDGTDQSAVLQDPSAAGQKAVYLYSYVPCHQALFRPLQSWRAIVTEKEKYVASQDGDAVALYDLENDPYEQRNLATDNTFVQLKAQLSALLADQVAHHDGYQAWQNLLKNHGLWQAWEDSDAYFQKIWAVFVAEHSDKTEGDIKNEGL
jgi:Arylsulfatase A and related enzymes